MSAIDTLACWLQNWFSNSYELLPMPFCHIIIMTIDNPGWGVTINLVNHLDNKELPLKAMNNDEDNWFYCTIRKNRFEGDGGLFNLKDILQSFKEICHVTFEDKIMQTVDDFAWLLRWFASQCDGDWEHGNGIRIRTIDNPGWSLSIDLEGTELEQEQFDEIEIERSETDWITCFIRDRKFEGRCGASNLLEILYIFRNWAE